MVPIVIGGLLLVFLGAAAVVLVTVFTARTATVDPDKRQPLPTASVSQPGSAPVPSGPAETAPIPPGAPSGPGVTTPDLQNPPPGPDGTTPDLHGPPSGNAPQAP
ncbi:hypothetical protein GCM10009560_56480 [Nonomuraea longicatena]|uniref:Uncharacterized protein n=1 Tax=Nonomuraea longicatena TaxID=83682 RepID=A0ABN1QJ10_9ACTN